MADLSVFVAEYITTRELTPAEPPSPPTPQLVLPAGYQLPQHYLTSVNFYTHVLRYAGPWPTNEFTICFWAHRPGDWELRSVSPYANRIWCSGNFRKIDATAVSRIEFAVEAGVVTSGLLVDVNSSDWHFIAIVRSGSDTYLSVDLQPFQTVTNAVGYATPWAEEFFTGGWVPFATWTPGFAKTPRVAYYRLWDTILGLTELRREATARTAVKTANLYRDTPLEASLSDVSGNGRDWTIPFAGTVVPSYGAGPLWWAAEGITVTDEAAAVLVSPGNLPRVELVGARDVARPDFALAKTFTEALTVGELVAVAPPDPLANATVRWYFQPSSPSFSPSVAQGGWTYTVISTGNYNLVPRSQLTGSIGAIQLGATVGDVAAGAGSTRCVNLITEALPAQTISGELNVCFNVYDVKSGTTRRTRFRVYGYVTVGASDTVRGVFLNYTAPSSTGNLWPTTTSQGRFWQFEAAVLLMPVAVQAGDRVVLELGFAHDAGYTSSFQGTIYQLCGANDLADAAPNTPGNTTTATIFNPQYGFLFANNWVEFSTGLLTNALGRYQGETITVAEGVTARIPALTGPVAETVTVSEEVRAELSGNLYLRVDDAVGVGESTGAPVLNLGVAKFEWRFPIDVVTARLRYRPQTYGETITVTDDVSVAAATPTNITRISVYDDVAVIESAGQDPEVTPPDAEGGGGEPEPTGDGIYVYDIITVDEYRLRELPTSVLEIRAYEYITVLELEQMASFPVVWDGSGAPPAPTTIADDYWLVGI